jgi:glycosyltransferase involved in cell wall biosynthesis
VDVLTSLSRPGLARQEEIRGVSVRRVWMPMRSPAGWIAHTLATIPAHAKLARQADIVHAHTFASAVPAMVTRSRGLPLVVTLHTSHFLRLARKSAWRPVLRRIIGAADYLLATSEEIRAVALDLYAHPRCEAITNAVDTDRFAPRREAKRRARPRIIVPRRLYPKNGVEYFVRAVPLILREIDAEAQVVGDGPERGRLERLAAELGVAGRIEFLGARENREMPALLGEADLAVIPSLVEATSVAALEAMACGLPVAASAVGGLPEIVDDTVGALFAPGDPQALASAVVSLLRRADLPALGAAGRRRVVSSWSLMRMVDHHIEIYSELVNEVKTARN